MTAICDLTKNIDTLIAYIKSSSMSAMDRRTDQVDNSTIAFPLRTHAGIAFF